MVRLVLGMQGFSPVVVKLFKKIKLWSFLRNSGFDHNKQL